MLENTEGAIKKDNPEKLAFLLPLRYSLTFISPVSCVPYLASFFGLYPMLLVSIFLFRKPNATPVYLSEDKER
jgi:hypothetical protein